MTMYHREQRELQDRFDTRRLADRLEDVKVHPQLSPSDAQFVASREIVFLATCDPDGQPTCSVKAGPPGFIRVVDPGTLLLPWYDGNGMFLTAGNVAATARIGLLLIDFEAPRRLRLEGDAELVDDPEVVGAFPGAQFAVRVRLRRAYPNCPRYIPRYQLVERSMYIPQEGRAAPTPDWKRADWARDVLPGCLPGAKSKG